MRIKRKPLILEAWSNSKDPGPGGKPAEPMPEWLKTISERASSPGTTFIFQQENFPPRLVSAGDIVYRAPDNSIHSISPKRFSLEYDVIDLQPHKSKVSTEEAKDKLA